MTERIKYSDTSGTMSEKGQHGTGGKPKTNRLTRSLRQTQTTTSITESQQSCQEDFKTPTRATTRSRYNNVCNQVNSPLNESDHQDIVWDATTPSPRRTYSKKGKKCYANVGIVDISEIVNRIAPKHGRPVVPESSLNQWIGESAIPCTPEVQQPKARKKSPRTNSVADLLKLAKEFDFNMHRQDEEHVKHKQSLDLRSDSDDVLDFDCKQDQPPPRSLNVTPETTQPTLQTNCVAVPNNPVGCDHEMGDDYDILFDGPTQYISDDISHNSLPWSMDVKTAPAGSDKPVFEKGLGSSHGHNLSVSSPQLVRRSQANVDFDDDWGNDLLDSSLVFEMTQNPDIFAPPKPSSVQSVSNESQFVNNNPAAISANAFSRRHQQQHQQESGDVQTTFSQSNKLRKHRKTFTLEYPHFQLNEGSKPSSKSVSAAEVHYLHNPKLTSSSNKASFMASGVQHSQRTQHQSNGKQAIPQMPYSQHGTLVSPKSSTSATTNSYSQKARQAEDSSYYQNAENDKSKGTDTIGAFASPCVVPEDDLDFIFASDSIWDDSDDDDLLCQVCDTLESQEEGMAVPVVRLSQSLSSNQAPSRSGFPVPAPLISGRHNVNENGYSVNKTVTETARLQNHILSSYSQSAPKNGSVFSHSLHNNSVPNAVVSGSTRPNCNPLPRNTAVSLSEPQTPMASDVGRTTDETTKQHVTGSGVQPLSCSARVNLTSNPSQFTFKRPSGCVSKFVNDGTSKVGKCSAEEIELKKKQAMERRRERMLTASNLKTLT
ncbi:hypothetical protein DPEC_G00177080 [Dallia pectoralis]|uniref:Uncharacterized protein n=1 Tax=Dallia pectoralis TaxID=75939 RepID=A0ACC2GEL1_DALPE|nr:hypothetical protein DPEC_G00177080 [Dallia pectoralis]